MWILLLLTGHSGSRDLTLGCMIWNIYGKNCWAYDACAGEVWTEGGFTFTLFHGWGVGSEVLLEQMQLNFNFWNKFIILLPCGLLVDNNTFSKMCVFKSHTLVSLVNIYTVWLIVMNGRQRNATNAQIWGK